MLKAVRNEVYNEAEMMACEKGFLSFVVLNLDSNYLFFSVSLCLKSDNQGCKKKNSRVLFGGQLTCCLNSTQWPGSISFLCCL